MLFFQSLYLQQKHIANHPTGRITVDLFNQPCCSKLPVFTNQFNDALRIQPAFLSYDLFLLGQCRLGLFLSESQYWGKTDMPRLTYFFLPFLHALNHQRMLTIWECFGFVTQNINTPVPIAEPGLTLGLTLSPKPPYNRFGRGTKKGVAFLQLLDFQWCHHESNEGHKDFQSFALPTELWHLFRLRVQR